MKARENEMRCLSVSVSVSVSVCLYVCVCVCLCLPVYPAIKNTVLYCDALYVTWCVRTSSLPAWAKARVTVLYVYMLGSGPFASMPCSIS